MPYRRKYRGKTKPYRGYRRRRSRGNYIFYRRLRNKMYRLARYVNVEFKQHNIDYGGTVNSTPAITQLTNIDQGDTDTTRDGSSIKITGIYLRGFARSNASTTNCIVRLIIVWDRQTNQAIYSADDLLYDSTQINSLLNIDNGRRFRVLWDKAINLDLSSNYIKPFAYYKKLNLHIRYDNTGNGIADLTENSLSMLAFSTAATNAPTVDINFRLRYVDN